MAKPLIVGIDPGTTSAVALLDMSGKVVFINSSKDFGLSKIISSVIAHGRPVVVAADKANVPSLVQDFASNTGARMIRPKEDLSVDEKKKLVQNSEEENNAKNSHELDALASALFAFKELRPLINKIDVFVKHYNKEKISDEIKFLVIEKEMSIRSAVELIEKPEEEISKIIQKVIDKKPPHEKDFIRLYDRLKSAEQENLALKETIEDLKKSVKQLSDERSRLANRLSSTVTDKKAKSLVAQKEARLVPLYSKIDKYEKNAEDLTTRMDYYNKIFSEINQKLVVKKLDNLGSKHFHERNRLLRIAKEDVLLVDDPAIFSKDVLEHLAEKKAVILFRKDPPKVFREHSLLLINSNKLTLVDIDGNFALADREKFIDIKYGEELFHKVLNDYKKQRNK